MQMEDDSFAVSYGVSKINTTVKLNGSEASSKQFLIPCKKVSSLLTTISEIGGKRRAIEKKAEVLDKNIQCVS